MARAESQKRYLRKTQVAERYQVSTRTLDRWAESGKREAAKAGAHWCRSDVGSGRARSTRARGNAGTRHMSGDAYPRR